MDNLEAQTYETFEKDTVKYIQVLCEGNVQSCLFLAIKACGCIFSNICLGDI